MLKSNGVHMKFSTVLMMIKILKTLSESILPIFFWVLMIFGMDVPYIAILTIIAAVIHEIGHIEAIRHLRLDRGFLRHTARRLLQGIL